MPRGIKAASPAKATAGNRAKSGQSRAAPVPAKAARTTAASPKVMTKAEKSPATAARRGVENAALKSAKPAGTGSQPKLSIQDLRVKVEKLEKLNSTLRVKSRNDRRAASEAQARVDILETELAALTAEAEAPAKPAKAAPVKQASAKPANAKRGARPALSSEPVPADQETPIPTET